MIFLFTLSHCLIMCKDLDIPKPLTLHTLNITFSSGIDLLAHHCDHLQVLQIRPLGHQNLFGNKVGFISGISLERDTHTHQSTQMS